MYKGHIVNLLVNVCNIRSYMEGEYERNVSLKGKKEKKIVYFARTETTIIKDEQQLLSTTLIQSSGVFINESLSGVFLCFFFLQMLAFTVLFFLHRCVVEFSMGLVIWWKKFRSWLKYRMGRF